MNKRTMFTSYALAAIAGICFVQGLAIIFKEKGLIKCGQNKGDCGND